MVSRTKKLVALAGSAAVIVGSLLYLNLKPVRDKPVFHSTTPVFSYPDGSIEAYRPLREGENLDDVLREGPVDSYVPPKNDNDWKLNSNENYTCDILVINPDGTSHYNVKEFNSKGEFLREYQKPLDRIFKRNPQYKEPIRNPEDKEC